MPENHKQIAAGSTQAADPLDPVLDAALAKYASVEPRAGLEERILASLRAERHPAHIVGWWRWGLAGALAIVIVAMALAWKTDRSAHTPIANHPPTTEQIRRPPNPPATGSSQNLVANSPSRATHSGATAVRKSAPRVQAVAQADPKLDVFPSPQPLSEEELALAQYVRNFPRDAQLVAQEQEASATEILRKMQTLANESNESN